MAFFFFHWDDEIIEHLAQHGVTQDEFAEVVQNPDERGTQSIDRTANGYRGHVNGQDPVLCLRND